MRDRPAVVFDTRANAAAESVHEPVGLLVIDGGPKLLGMKRSGTRYDPETVEVLERTQERMLVGA